MPLQIKDGGTGQATAAGARIKLGLEIGADVQEHSPNLDTVAAVTPGSKGLQILADVTADDVHDDLAIDWSDGTANAPSLSVPNVMQRKYIDVGTYARTDDTLDAHAAIQAAFDDANGREVVFTNPYGGTRYYRSTTRPSGAGATNNALTLPKRGRVIAEPGTTLDFSNWANSGTPKFLMYVNGGSTFGSAPSSVSLASTALITAEAIVLTAGGGASFSRGWHVIASDEFYTTQEGSLGTKGEWIYVTDVSTDTLNLLGKLRDTYTTTAVTGTAQAGTASTITLQAGTTSFGKTIVTTGGTGAGQTRTISDYNPTTLVATVSSNWTVTPDNTTTYSFSYSPRVYPLTDLCRLSLEGFNIIGPGQFSTNTDGDRGIWIENGIGCRVIDCSIYGSDANTITFQNVLHGLIEGCRIEFDPTGTNTVNQYGPHLSSLCENVTVRNCEVIGGKEGLGMTTSGGLVGIARDNSFINNRVRGAWRSGLAFHDSHINSKVLNNYFEDVDEGIDVRILGAEIRGNTIKNLPQSSAASGLSYGIQLGSGASKTIIADNLFENMQYGVYRPSPIVDETITGAIGDVFITNNIMRDLTQYGVRIQRNTADDQYALGTLAITHNDITFTSSGGNSPRGIDVEGNWNTPNISYNMIRGSGAGVANRAIYLHNTSAGGSFGPINPIVIGNRWDKDEFTEPLIQHSTGKWNYKDNEPFDAVALPDVTSASAITPSMSGDVFNITGTTTINTINNAAALVGKVITLLFTDTITITHLANAGAANDISLSTAANFSAVSNDTLVLVSNGTVWEEVSRTGFKQGTFTPALTFSTPGNLAVTYSTQIGRYSKHNRNVNFDILLVTSAFTHTTASGNLSITGLPFTASSAGFSVANAMEWAGITKAGYTNITGRVLAGGTTLSVIGSGSGVAVSAVTAADMPTGGSVRILISGTYTI